MPVSFSIPPQWLRRARWFAVGLLGVWVLAWLAVPPWVKSLVQEQGSQALGRTVTVGAVAFRPWSLELILTDVAVAASDGKSKQLEIARVYVDAELESVLRMAPVMDAIAVDAPTLRITHLGDGRYDVDDIIATLSQAPTSTSAPLQFALYNLTLNGGAVDFTDHTAAGVRQHSVRALHLAVPFLSTLESKRTVKVVPRLAFTLNGSSFDTAAEGTPFAQTHKGEASLKISHLDLAPYVPYLPSSLPLRVQSAVVDADLRLAFEQAAQSRLALTGTFKVSRLALADAAGAPLLAVESVAAELADVRPLERIVKLAALQIDAPRLQATRNRTGRINLALGGLETAAQDQLNATKSVAAPSISKGAGGHKTIKTAPVESGWKLALERLVLHKGEVTWADDTTPNPARMSLAQLELQAHGLQWPLTAAAARMEGSAQLPFKAKAAALAFRGEATQDLASLHASVGDLDLGLGAPYAAQFLHPGVQGAVDAQADATWTADPKGGQLKVAVPRLVVRDFALKAANGPLTALEGQGATNPTGAAPAAAEMPRFKLLEVTDATFDLSARSGTVARIALRSPSAMLHRDAQGQWMVQRWLKTTVVAPTVPAEAVAEDAKTAVPGTAAPADTGASTPARGEPATASSAAISPWQLVLGELAVDDGLVKLDDRSLTRPTHLEVSNLKLQLKNAALDGSKPAPLLLSARVKAGRTEPGTLNFRGTVAWSPVAAQGSIEAVDLPLHAVAPYIADQLNIAILRADASFKGQVRYAATATGPEVYVLGDASLEDFRANSVAGVSLPGAADADADASDEEATEELLSWKSLNASGVALNLLPGSATRLQVRDATLSDFFARVIVKPDGRLNLQELVKSAQPAVAGQGRSDMPVATASTPVSPTTPPAAIVNIGPIRLVNGKVLFSDRFIRPNYSADLSQLQGTLGQFASQTKDGAVQMADLELRGRAEGTAALEVTGKVNPLAKPLALDIQGKVRDLDLPPLTAYSIKYAGYGIERGKLSMDVTYAVRPDGQLIANNKLVLNQLSFGDEVKDAPNSLPVKLAVALLADGHGVIDIDLPIRGSLNDPQFSFGAIAWKVVTNLIGKALTSPFSLLAHAMGSGGVAQEDASAVVFAPGSAALTPSAMQALDQIAKGLSTRPMLNVTVAGIASLEAERDGFRRERLKALVRAEKRRRAVAADQDDAERAELADSEYTTLLKDVYRRADISKPRNLVGLAKDIPHAQMEALLLASIPANEDAMRELALQRSVVVKDYLASRKLPVERLFVAAAKTVAAEPEWKPRVELGVTER